MMMKSCNVYRVTALVLALVFATETAVFAGWGITTPTANEDYSLTTNIAGTGSAPAGANNYVAKVTGLRGIVLQSGNGVSANLEWSITLTAPPWTAGNGEFVLVPAGGGGPAGVAISLSGS